jgi:Na+-driven multidrug efflux pump
VLIGRFGPDALYVRTLYLPVSYILSAFQIGIDISTLVAVSAGAARTGADLGRIVRPVLGAGLLAITSIAAVIVATSSPLGQLLGVQVGTGRQFVPFLALMCAVAVLDIPCMVLTAALRGSGHPGRASIVVVTVMMCQVAGVALFGGALGLGLMGVPPAVAASIAVGLALDAVFLHRAGLLTGLFRHAPAPGGLRRALKVLASVGVPVGGTFVVLFLANGATLRVLGAYGEAAVAGYGIANTTQIVIVVPALGLGTAVAILVNQKASPAAGIVRRGAVLATALYATLGLLIFAGAGPIARLAAPDRVIGGVAEDYLRVVGPTLACVGVMLAALTLLEQTGSGFIALAFNAVYFGLGLGIGAALAHRAGSYRPLFDTMAVANALALAALAPILVRRIRRL